MHVLLLRHGRSLEKLAAYSGLSKKKLEAVVTGELVPTINLLQRITNALGVPLGSLISARQRRGLYLLRKVKKNVIPSSDGGVSYRPLFPHDCRRLVEFYELTLAPHHAAAFEANASGTLQSLIVVKGHIEVSAGREPTQRLVVGDAIVFDGDAPHSYRNLGSSAAQLHLVISYIKLADASAGDAAYGL